MPLKTENINEFSLTGRVSYKRYDEKERRLQFVLVVLIPRLNRAKKEGEDFYSDFPGFILEGDEAEEWNKKMERGTRLTVRGHMESVRQQEWAGRNYYKLVNVIRPVIDEMNETQGLVMKNNVRLKGKVSRVMAGTGNSHYYIITIRTEQEDGTRTSIPCFYFDPRMTLNPQVNDEIDIEGVISTRRVPLEFDKARTSVRLSVVIQAVYLEKVSESGAQPGGQKQNSNVTTERVEVKGEEVSPLDADEPVPEEVKPADPEDLVSDVEQVIEDAEKPEDKNEQDSQEEETDSEEAEETSEREEDMGSGNPDMPVIADDEFDTAFDPQ